MTRTKVSESMSSSGLAARRGSAASVPRNAARSARSSGDREKASRSSSPASGSASTLIAIATPRLVNSNTVSVVLLPATAIPISTCPPNSTAASVVPANDRNMSLRSACPSSKASPMATATPSSAMSTPVEARATQLGTNPSGMIRMALPSAKNNVATMTKPTTGRGCARRVTAWTSAASTGTDSAPNMTQCPSRNGPSTSPASVAPSTAVAATTVTSATSAARLRPLSRGRDNSSSTASHAMPGTATR